MIIKLHEVAKELDAQSQQHKTCTSSYITCFEQISKILGQFGLIFSFVTRDIDSKLSILRTYKDTNGSTHQYLETMMQYEVDNKITILPKGKSGSRTLLRLHRALEFFIRFLEKVLAMNDDDSAAAAASDAYGETLQKHHSFMVRSSVWVAFKSLGTKAQLMVRVKEEEEGVEPETQHLKDICDWLNDIYNNVEQCFVKHNLQNLP